MIFKILCVTVMCLSTMNVVETFSIENCFKLDSVSCIQIQIYQTARTLLEKTNLGISKFFNLSTSLQNPDNKSPPNFDEKQGDKIMHAGSVEQRQILLEKYVGDELKNLWSKVSISSNKSGILRYVLGFLPKDVIQEVEEARSKQKKTLQMLLPWLIGAGLKLAVLVAITYMTIATVASKALLAGSVALIISGYIAVKNFTEGKQKSTMMMENSWETDTNSNNPYSKYQWSRSNAMHV